MTGVHTLCVHDSLFVSERWVLSNTSDRAQLSRCNQAQPQRSPVERLNCRRRTLPPTQPYPPNPNPNLNLTRHLNRTNVHPPAPRRRHPLPARDASIPRAVDPRRPRISLPHPSPPIPRRPQAHGEVDVAVDAANGHRRPLHRRQCTRRGRVDPLKPNGCHYNDAALSIRCSTNIRRGRRGRAGHYRRRRG